MLNIMSIILKCNLILYNKPFMHSRNVSIKTFTFKSVAQTTISNPKDV